MTCTGCARQASKTFNSSGDYTVGFCILLPNSIPQAHRMAQQVPVTQAVQLLALPSLAFAYTTGVHEHRQHFQVINIFLSSLQCLQHLMRHVVIGGGIAGVCCVEELCRLRPNDSITLVSSSTVLKVSQSDTLAWHFSHSRLPCAHDQVTLQPGIVLHCCTPSLHPLQYWPHGTRLAPRSIGSQ